MPVVTKSDATGQLSERIALNLSSEIVAATGTVIGNAAALSANANLHIVTGANDAVGVILPATSAGQLHVIYSANATNGLLVYPPVNSTINGGSANSSINIEGKTMAILVATNATNWGMMYTVNS